MPLRDTAPKLTPEEYEKNFADITPPMNPQAGGHRSFALPLLL